MRMSLTRILIRIPLKLKLLFSLLAPVLLVLNSSAVYAAEIQMVCHSKWNSEKLYFKYKNNLFSDRFYMNLDEKWRDVREFQCAKFTQGDSAFRLDWIEGCGENSWSGTWIVDFEILKMVMKSMKELDKDGKDITRNTFKYAWRCEFN